MKLPLAFYLSDDVVQTARKLIGCTLHTNFDGLHTAVMITETEAYAGITDRASHAWNGCFTNRTATMYRQGGIAYVYLCYGIHHLFNVVTAVQGIPHAVLIRGGNSIRIYQVKDLDPRPKSKSIVQIDGPGRLSKALGITLNHNGISLLGDQIWIEAATFQPGESQIMQTSRIGIDYAEKDARLPYRFVLKGAQSKTT